MLEGKDAEANRLLEDYRNFFNFEIDVRSNGVTVTDFSKRMDKGSGASTARLFSSLLQRRWRAHWESCAVIKAACR